MKLLKSVTAVSLISSLLTVHALDTAANRVVTEPPKPRPLKKDVARRRRVIVELPDDPALPALKEIREASQTGKFPAFGGPPFEFLVRSYKPGKRVVEMRAAHRRFAVNAYSSAPDRPEKS